MDIKNKLHIMICSILFTHILFYPLRFCISFSSFQRQSTDVLITYFKFSYYTEHCTSTV